MHAKGAPSRRKARLARPLGHRGEEFRPDVTLVLFDVSWSVTPGRRADAAIRTTSTTISAREADEGVRRERAGGPRVLLTATYNRPGTGARPLWERTTGGGATTTRPPSQLANEHPDTVQVGDLNRLVCPGGRASSRSARDGALGGRVHSAQRGKWWSDGCSHGCRDAPRTPTVRDARSRPKGASHPARRVRAVWRGSLLRCSPTGPGSPRGRPL